MPKKKHFKIIKKQGQLTIDIGIPNQPIRYWPSLAKAKSIAKARMKKCANILAKDKK